MIDKLIAKYQIQAKTLLEVINNSEMSDTDKERAAASRRFVIGFINDLNQVKNIGFEPHVSGSLPSVSLLRDCWSAACASGYHNYPSLNRMQKEFDKWLEEHQIEVKQ